jgi:hypothetical protein
VCPSCGTQTSLSNLETSGAVSPSDPPFDRLLLSRFGASSVGPGAGASVAESLCNSKCFADLMILDMKVKNVRKSRIRSYWLQYVHPIPAPQK